MGFYVGSFKEALNTEGFEEICDFKINPYGHATYEKHEDHYNFECQHEENECYGNTMEVCANHYYSKKEASHFVVCLSEKTVELDREVDFDVIGKECTDNLGLDFDAVHECTNNSEGNKL